MRAHKDTRASCCASDFGTDFGLTLETPPSARRWYRNSNCGTNSGIVNRTPLQQPGLVIHAA